MPLKNLHKEPYKKEIIKSAKMPQEWGFTDNIFLDVLLK